MIRFAVENNASDIHMSSNNVPAYRVNGVVTYFEGFDALDDETVLGYIAQVLPSDGLIFCQPVTTTAPMHLRAVPVSE